MSQKNILLVVIVFLVLLLGGGGLYLFAHNSTSQNTQLSPTPTQIQVLTLQPSDIGLALTATTYTKKTSSGPAMHMEITKLDGISSIDCEIHYSHVIDSGDRITEGVLCNLDAKGQSKISQDFPFATCSDVCHFHKDVKDIEAIIKVTKTDGKIYQVKDTMTL